METIQSGKLILDGVSFMLEDSSDTKFFVFGSDEKEGTITISFDIAFQNAEYQNEMVSPFISVQQHETGKTNIEELVGCKYTVENIEEADDREDTFCIFEHEPMEKYTFTIIEISGQLVHIQLEGVAVVDGYADPYEKADFSGDVWLCFE